MELILIRGLPGSGKSTFAEVLNNNGHYIHLEADMFFIQPDGTYKFIPDLVPVAHKWCINTAKIFLNNKKSVIVSNTFTTLKEMKPYLEHAESLNIGFSVYRMMKNFGSIHNVPESVIERMKDRFEDFEKEYRMDEEKGA